MTREELIEIERIIKMTPLGELYYNHNVKPLEEQIQKQGETLRNQGKTIRNQGKTIRNQGETIRNQGETIRKFKKNQQFTHELVLRIVNGGLEKGEKLEEILETNGISKENYAQAIQYQTEKEKKERRRKRRRN
ncbi:MAG: hypothetical protein IIY58_02060 [Aeriscardovia sp.]|nr:hypothetical protein [Aeriscardovia sp.]